MDLKSVNSQVRVYKYNDFTNKVNLGQGEFGTVYGATHHTIPKVAVRILSRNFHATQNECQALLSEAGLLRSIASPHILSFYGVVLEMEHLCLVLEYAEYGSLSKVLQRVEMQWPMKIVFAYEIALGMAYLHDQTVLHLRLKSSNVLICENMNAKIADMKMGFDGRMSSWNTYAMTYAQTQLSTCLNTAQNVAHFSPEILQDINHRPGKPSDVYAYGIILWQIITNKTPYEGKRSDEVYTEVKNGGRPSMGEVPKAAPEILQNLMKKSWEQNREQRPSFTAIREELQNIYAENYNLSLSLKQRYQTELNDFNHQNNICFSPPESDMTRPRRSQPQADAPATSIMFDEQLFAEDRTGQQCRSSETEIKVLPLIPPNPRVHECGSMDKDDEGTPDFPLYPPNDESTKTLYNVAEELGPRNWRKFGHRLGFSDGEMDNIQANYHCNGYPEIPYQMLRQWCEKKCRDAKFDHLWNLLRESGFEHISLKLKQ